MSARSLARLAPFSSFVFAVLLLVGAVVVGNYDYLPSGDSIVSFFTDDGAQIFLGAYLALLGVLFLGVFVGVVVSRMRQALRASVLPDIALAGGAAAVALAAAGFGLLLVGGERAGSADGIPVATAIGLFDVYGTLVGSAMPIVLAAFTGAVGLAGLTDGVVPGWLGVVSIILAVAMASPVAYIAIALVIIWAPIVGVVLYRSGPSPAA